MQKIKYITNKDLLSEIKMCKASFCWFTSPEYAVYDTIVTNANQITTALVNETILTKAARLSSKIVSVDPANIPPESIVFRVMTDSHLPPIDDKKRRLSPNGSFVKINFNPFRHFILQDGELVEVGRSHWRGDFETGCFNVDHGKINNRLANMFILLVEQYSRRGNWRGYCYSQDTEALTQRGWLNMDEITTEDIILSYDQVDDKLKWGEIKSIFRDDYDGKMFKLDVAGMDALVTPGHKFVTKDGAKEVERLVEKDRLILMGGAVADGSGDYSDAFVELVGWTVTEGCYQLVESKNYHHITIYQNEGVKADRIRVCLNKLEARFSESHKLLYTENRNVAFSLTKEMCLQLESVAPNRVLSMSFILALTEAQRELLINTMVDGDGYRTSPYEMPYSNYDYKGGYMRYNQKDKKHLDAFLVLCTLNGYRTSTTMRDIVSFGKLTQIYNVNIFSKTYDRHRCSTVENIDFHGGKRNGRAHPGQGQHAHPNEPTFDYKGRVWCPHTEYGTLVVRRNGTIYIGHNSYNDEMRSHALVQLAQVGLQFDESRSDNPFAFYTQIIKNCLAGETEILTREYGSIPIADVAGQDVTLLDGNGDWVKSHIYDYGIQETVNLNFYGGFEKISIRSTMDHGWVERGSGERIETKDFVHKNGYPTKNLVIDDLRPTKTIMSEIDYRAGVVHGIVYGDGSLSYGERNFIIRVCKGKEELEQWLSDYPKTYPESSNGDPTYFIKDRECDLKTFPENPGRSLDYLLGFLRGWMATDGCASDEKPRVGHGKLTEPTSQATLCCDLAEYDWLKQWGPLVGWHVRGFTKLSEETNYGKRNKISLNIHLKKDSLDVEDFLRQKHRERWQQVETREKGWSVYPGNRQTFERRMERVYCPDVQTTHTLALSCGIHSFQCFRRILNLERRNQDIRDDLLIMAGAMPSYTRQADNEFDQREDQLLIDKPARRGRKPKAISG